MSIPSRNTLQDMTRQARHVVNARLSYTDKKLQAHLGINYRSPYLNELNLFSYVDPATGEQVIRENNDFDEFMGRSLGMDASFKYLVHRNVVITADLMNLLNTEFVRYRGERGRPVKTEYYGVRALLGVQLSVFAPKTLDEIIELEHDHSGHDHHH
jgi:hypothetical protein